MLDLQRGQKISIQTVCRTWTLEVELRHQGPLAVDVSCFGLDSAGRLSDERYFLFYNQRRSPEGAMALSEGASGGTARFQVDLAALPDHIQRLSFTAAIDGGRTLRELEQGSIGLWVRGEEMARYAYAGNEFSGERAIVAGELYRKNGDWKFSAVGRGFNGGLRALVESFGGVVSDPVPPPPPPVRTAVSARTTRQPAAPAGGPPPSVGDILRSLPPHVCTRMEGLAAAAKGTWTSWRRCTKPPLQHWPRCPGQRRGTFRRSCAPMPPAPCSTCTAGAGSSRCSTSSSPCPPPCQTAAPWTAGPLLRRAASWSR